MRTPTPTRRQFLATAAAGPLLLLPRRAATAPRPNILFFLADDQRNDILGCAGHPILKTPRIDALADAGTRFTHAFVTTPICAASRASILTGTHERTHGYTFGTPPVSEALARDSYPARLREAGYRTGFVGKYGVDMALPPEALFDDARIRDRPYWRDGRHIDEINAEDAIDFLNAQTPKRPFCLSLSFSSPHGEDGDLDDHFPCFEAVRGMYDDVPVPRPRLDDPAIFEALPEFLRESLNRDRYYWRWDTPEKYARNMRAYLAMISGVDLLIGRVLDRLDALGLAENTVVVFASDNGYYMAERGLTGKWSHYDESLRVPLIVRDPRAPRRRRGRTVDAMALNIDLAPTFLDWAGLPAPSTCAGRSLSPWISQGSAPNWRGDCYCEHRMNHPRIPKWEGVRGTRHVYARYFEQDPVYEFLHDLRADPDQLVNLASDPAHTDTLETFRARCAALSDRYAPNATK